MKIKQRDIEGFLRERGDQCDHPTPLRRERERYLGGCVGRITEMIKRMDAQPGMKILEIGATPFFTSRALIHFLELNPSQFFMIDGSGISDGDVTRKTHRFPECEFEIYSLNAERTPFPFGDETFDWVICQDVIEHLLFDPMFLVRESNRVLKRGGRFILSTSPSVYCWSVSLRHLFHLNVEMGYDLASHNPYARHHRLFSLRELKQMVAFNGFNLHAAFARTHSFLNEPGMGWKSRISRRTFYILDRSTEVISHFLPCLQEKAGSQIWVIADKRKLLPEIAYPPTLNMHSDFS